MPQGNVRWYDKVKGYGFVKHEDEDVFIHYSAIKEKYVPENGDLISFEVVPGLKGLKAQNITKITKAG